MPAATGAIGTCERMCLALEKEVDSAFEDFVSASESGSDFHASMERIEGQIAAASKLANAVSDFELNETAVLADKIDDELVSVGALALGAVLSDTEEAWATEFERARTSLDALSLHLKKMKSAQGQSELRASLLSFRRHSKLCQARLKRLKSIFASKTHPIYSKVAIAKNNLKLIRSGVAKSLEKISRQRLQKSIDTARTELSQFMKRTGSGRIFVDNKHVTFSSEGRTERLLLTQAVRFALEEIAPYDRAFAKVATGGSFITGSYRKDGSGLVLRLGERSIVGDTVIYRERSFRIS